jgi:hypothetical protein
VNRKAVVTVDDVIERLRASKAKRDGILSAEGRAAGQSRARHKAEADENANLAYGRLHYRHSLAAADPLSITPLGFPGQQLA